MKRTPIHFPLNQIVWRARVSSRSNVICGWNIIKRLCRLWNAFHIKYRKMYHLIALYRSSRLQTAHEVTESAPKRATRLCSAIESSCLHWNEWTHTHTFFSVELYKNVSKRRHQYVKSKVNNDLNPVLHILSWKSLLKNSSAPLELIQWTLLTPKCV